MVHSEKADAVEHAQPVGILVVPLLSSAYFRHVVVAAEPADKSPAAGTLTSVDEWVNEPDAFNLLALNQHVCCIRK